MATRNFLESGHGKGAPDGVGAALKRSADASVCMGKDIVSTRDFFRELKIRNTSGRMFMVESETVDIHSIFSLESDPFW